MQKKIKTGTGIMGIVVEFNILELAFMEMYKKKLEEEIKVYKENIPEVEIKGEIGKSYEILKEGINFFNNMLNNLDFKLTSPFEEEVKEVPTDLQIKPDKRPKQRRVEGNDSFAND